MKDTLAEGLTTTRRFEIDEGRALHYRGAQHRGCATGSGWRDVVVTCRDLIFSHLDDGEDTVGARIEVDHLGATLLDSWVDVTVTVTSTHESNSVAPR